MPGVEFTSAIQLGAKFGENLKQSANRAKNNRKIVGSVVKKGLSTPVNAIMTGCKAAKEVYKDTKSVKETGRCLFQVANRVGRQAITENKQALKGIELKPSISSLFMPPIMLPFFN